MDTVKGKIEGFISLMKEETPKKYSAVFAITVVLALLCELFIFNFKWISSVYDEKIGISPNIISGASLSGENVNIIDDSATLEFRDIDSKIKYMRFTPGYDENTLANITVSATDEANAHYLSAPVRTVMTSVKPSQYIRLHFSGEVGSLRIQISGMKNKSISMDDIELNCKVPLMISWLRVLIFILLLMTLYAVRHNSILYQYKTDLTKKSQKLIVAVLIVVQASVMFGMLNWNTYIANIQDISYSNHHIYNNLVDSFKEGRLDIEYGDISEELWEMKNPYDKGSRNFFVPWDHAYYNGKFYCYFGVVPAILVYLPFNIITGQHMPNRICLYIFFILTMIGVMLLLWEIIKKWFKDTPFVIYLMLSALSGPVMGIAQSLQKPDFYAVPIMSGIAFGLLGLYFWLSSEQIIIKKAKHKAIASKTIVPWRMAAGSTCIALISGCRPQMLLVIAIGVMFFWNAVFKDRLLFSRSSIKETLALCMPIVIIALAMMWYNYARFGSPFDFGANYNLTTNDMTHRGFVWGRTGLGLFSYFIQPFKIDAVFPFMHDFGVATAYQGLTLTEKMIGGVFWVFPILIMSVYGLFKKNIFDDKRVYRMVYFSIIIAVILAFLDTQMAGILSRYFMDFVWFLMIASCITVFAYYKQISSIEKSRANFIKLITALSVITMILMFLRIFAHSEDSIQASNPTLYYSIQHLIAFWL